MDGGRVAERRPLAHTATLLGNGKVLVAGGVSSSGYLASAELYDPATNTWSAAPSMNSARYRCAATLLPTGKVLVAGGFFQGITATAELYDPVTNAWSAAPNMTVGRDGRCRDPAEHRQGSRRRWPCFRLCPERRAL